MLAVIKKSITAIALMIAIMAPVALPGSMVQAACTQGNASTKAAYEGIGLTGAECNADTKVNNILASIVNILTLVIGAISVIMIIVAGFKYITSGGDSNNVASAKNTLVYAVVGLIIVVLAQAITRFVIGFASK